MTGLEVSDVNISIAVALEEENEIERRTEGKGVWMKAPFLLLANTRRKPWEEEN